MRSGFVTVAAGAILAFLGVIGNPENLWTWIAAIFFLTVILVLEVVNHRREINKSHPLGMNYKHILRRTLNLIADLSNLTGREFDLWVVDLYLRPNSKTMWGRTYAHKLELSLHIALTDVGVVNSVIELKDNLFGRCFTDRRSELWWDVDLAPSSEENSWVRLADGDNAQIRKEYGIMSVNPVVNDLGRDCLGLLVVHASRDAETVTKVLGTLRERKGKRQIAAACVDIHGFLRP